MSGTAEDEQSDMAGDASGSQSAGRDEAEPIADPAATVLGVDGLTRRFGEIWAVDDVSLAVAEGELRAIIGPNGAGKTTLFNCVMGALPPTAGSIYLDGEEITDHSEERRPHLGLARSFQSNQLFTDQTVLENIRLVVQTTERGAFSLDLFRNHHGVGRDRAIDIAESIGLSGTLETEAKNLSHGDQRRLGIAMALATDPEVLLLDEPTSGMSPSATADTAALIEDVRDERDLTVVLIEHDMDVVLSISDRISVLDRGSIIATGTPAEIQDDEAVQDAYLGGMREEL